MRFTSISTLLMSLIVVVIIAAIVYLFILLIRALRKYLRSGEVRQENRAAVESLAKALKGHRERCRMTQEFVAEIIGTMPTSNLSPTAVRTLPVMETTAIIIAQEPSASWGMISF